MRRNRISMLTGRPDVPHTPFGRLKPRNGFFEGRHKNAPTILATMFLGFFYNMLLHKNNLFRGHLQPLKVNSRTFQSKNVFLGQISYIVLLMALLLW